jgi:RNA polymerase sigma factor for flagellar operon FliA
LSTSPRRADQLWLDYQRTGDERFKAELVRLCMRKVHAVAKQLRAEMGGVPAFRDLVEAGTIGLMQAFERFNPTRGVYFETWASWRILGSMLDEQRKCAWTTERVRLKAHRLGRAVEEMSTAHGRPPTDEELADALGIPPAEAIDLRRHAEQPKPVSLDTLQEESARDLDPALIDPRPDPARRLLAEEARARLLDALKALPDKQRYTLLLYYFEKLTMAQIGQVLDITESRVSQLHKKALETLSRRLGHRKDEFLDALGA